MTAPVDDAAPPERTHAAAPADARTRKFRQAAFAYLHVALLYEAAVFVLWRGGLLPEGRGSGLLWLFIGAAIAIAIVLGLWFWRNAWFARVIWALHALRLPAIIQGAFFADPAAVIPAGLWAVALPIVLINLWLLARAGWDI